MGYWELIFYKNMFSISIPNLNFLPASGTQALFIKDKPAAEPCSTSVWLHYNIMISTYWTSDLVLFKPKDIPNTFWQFPSLLQLYLPSYLVTSMPPRASLPKLCRTSFLLLLPPFNPLLSLVSLSSCQKSSYRLPFNVCYIISYHHLAFSYLFQIKRFA